MATITDTDKSGQGFQKQKVWLGPSLGWSEEYVQPQTKITTPGTHVVQPGEGLLLVDAGGPVTIQLPDVRKWWQQPADQPATGWNRQICIKDFAGTATTHNIVVVPFPGQSIDKFIGTTAITENHAVFILVPTVDLTGWAIAAGTTAGVIVGTFLPVHNPNATGTLTVSEIGGNIAGLKGSSITQQAITLFADSASVDDDVNVHIIPKNAGGVSLYSNNALQVNVSGPPDTTKFLVLSGAVGGQFPTIATSFGGQINIRDSLRVGPVGGNMAFVEGSLEGQQGIFYRADPLSPDPHVNVHIMPKGAGGTNLHSNGSLQVVVAGPPSATEYLVIAGANGLDDPLIANSNNDPVRIHNAVLAGPPGGNLAGVFGSAAGQQGITFTADNVVNPDADINVHLVPKNAGSIVGYCRGAAQVVIGGPADAVRALTLTGGQAAGNPTISTLGGGNVEIPDLVMTGNPTAPTPPPGDNDTSVATTAFVFNAVSGGGSFLPIVGGTLTGNLTISTVAPVLTMEASTGSPVIDFKRNGNFRWELGVGGAETGGNQGSDFSIWQADDAGTFAPQPAFKILRAGPISVFAGVIQVYNPGTTSQIQMFKATGAFSNQITGRVGVPGAGTTRWSILPGDEAAEGGGNVGSNFQIRRFDDAGVLINTAFHINRANGAATFSGNVTVSHAGPPILALQKPAGAFSSTIVGASAGGVGRWGLLLGDETAESGGNTGSDFQIRRFDDAGTLIDTPLQISRANGVSKFGSNINIAHAGTPNIVLEKPVGAFASQILGRVGITARWAILLGDGSTESGSNTGSNFVISRFNDAGTPIDQPLSISRVNGIATFSATPVAPTPPTADNGTNVATTAFVKAQNYTTLSDVNTAINGLAQPLDADLTALAALSGTNTIYYRSAANTWTAVTIGGNMSFSAGTLNSNGNVAGPASSVDNTIARYDLATGKVIQGSGVVITDANEITSVTKAFINHTADLNVDGAPTRLQVASLTTTDWTATFLGYGANGSGPATVMGKSRGASVGTHGAVLNTDTLGQTWFYGSNGTSWINAANIKCKVNATPSGSVMPARFEFEVQNSTGVLTNIATMTSGGGVQILGGSNGADAAAGNVGEYVQSLLGAPITPTVSVTTNIFNIVLTAGDWDVWLNCQVIPASAGGMEIELSSSATLSGTFPNYVQTGFLSPGASNYHVQGPLRFLSGGAITVTLVVRAGVAGMQISKAMLAARRRR